MFLKVNLKDNGQTEKVLVYSKGIIYIDCHPELSLGNYIQLED